MGFVSVKSANGSKGSTELPARVKATVPATTLLLTDHHTQGTAAKVLRTAGCVAWGSRPPGNNRSTAERGNFPPGREFCSMLVVRRRPARNRHAAADGAIVSKAADPRRRGWWPVATPLPPAPPDSPIHREAKCALPRHGRGDHHARRSVCRGGEAPQRHEAGVTKQLRAPRFRGHAARSLPAAG